MLSTFGAGSARAFGMNAFVEVPVPGLIISTCYGSPATVNNINGGPSLTNVNSVATSSLEPSGTGKINSASFNGSNSYLQSTLSSENAIQGTGDFTLSFYAKRDAYTPSYERIFSLSNGTTEISVEDYSTILANSVTVNTGGLAQLTRISVGNIENWFRFTVLRESGTLKVYVGTSLATTQSNSTNFSAFTNFRVGSNNDATRLWDGLIHNFEFNNEIAVVPT
tara:strand:- start:232 stop:900 length:669 start_codon:yes stop_codon:yes gene_type:complete